jgi:hypothetical protein
MGKIAFIFTLVMLTLVVQSVIWTFYQNPSTIGQKIDCYDLHGNKIIGIECVDSKSYISNFYIMLGISILLEILILIFISMLTSGKGYPL